MNNDYAELLYNKFPKDYENEFKGNSSGNYGMSKIKDFNLYCNPLEIKYINDNLKSMDKEYYNFFHILSTNKIVNIFSKLSSIPTLEYDPYLLASGLHSHPRYGRNNIHLDYEKHPILENKERRLNIILYLTKNWKKEWGGDTQLWNEDVTKCCSKTHVEFNKACIFITHDIGWHGVPDIMLCPEGNFRKTLCYTYISPLINAKRTRSVFFTSEKVYKIPKLKKLYDIRAKRRIEKEDIDNIWPEWRPDLNPINYK